MRQKIRRTTLSCKRNVQNLVQLCACELKGNSAKRVFKRYFDEVGKGTFQKKSDPPYGGADSDTLVFCCRNLWSLHPRGSKFCRLLWKNIPTGPASEFTLHRGGSVFFWNVPKRPKICSSIQLFLCQRTLQLNTHHGLRVLATVFTRQNTNMHLRLCRKSKLTCF